MIYTNLSESQLKKVIQTKIKFHQKENENDNFLQIINQAKKISKTTNIPFESVKVVLFELEFIK